MRELDIIHGQLYGISVQFRKGLFISALVLLAACAGTSTATSLAQSCSAWGSTLFVLGDLRHQNKLTTAQIAAVDELRVVANASCASDVAQPESALAALRAALTRARAIQRTAER